MSRLKIGVIGIGRGTNMVRYCEHAGDCELVAVCDKWEKGLKEFAKEHGDKIAYYTDYDEFLKHDMDVVILANYATEHAPFAIKAMNAGKNVFSEVLPCQCPAEAVALIETIEKTGRKYCYLENYCYMPAAREIRRLYQAGILGEFEYAEGEYNHNCESIWANITYGERDHWRNRMFSTFYCTHSLGPIIHAIKMHPIRVTGFETPFNARSARTGRRCGSAALEIVEFENGALAKSLHGDLSKDSIWYTLYGSKGRAESARDETLGAYDPNTPDVRFGGDDFRPGMMRVFTHYNPVEGDYRKYTRETYEPVDEFTEESLDFGHCGSDFYSIREAVKYVNGDENADIIDVYEALDMFLPGLFAYYSILEDGKVQNIPNFKLQEDRDRYRNDYRCTDPNVAGDQLLPTTKFGNPEVPQEVYDAQKKTHGHD